MIPMTNPSMMLDPATAMITPITPPETVMIRVSAMIILPMSRPEAPIALSIPNSLVLSFTDIRWVLRIPKALMIIVMAMTVIRRDLAEAARFIIVPMTWAMVTTWMSGILSISAEISEILLKSSTLTAMVVIFPSFLERRWASERGRKWNWSSWSPVSSRIPTMVNPSLSGPKGRPSRVFTSNFDLSDVA